MKFLSEVRNDEIWATRQKYFNFLYKDTNMSESFKLLIDKLFKVNLLNNKIGYKVGDIGCGTGWAGEMFCSGMINSSLFLVDTSKQFNYAFEKKDKPLFKNQNSPIYKQGTFSELPFDDCFFDVLIYNAAIHHEKNLHNALNESLRVLKKGGLLIISNEHFLKEFEFIVCFFKKNIRLFLNIFNGEKYPQSISNAFIEYDARLGDRYYRRTFFKKLAKDLGLCKIDIIDTKFKPYKNKFTEYKLSHFIYKKI